MQSDHKQVYKFTAIRTGKSEQMYKDLGNFVFTETYNMLRKPKSLITKLKGIGSWHLRKKRMEIVVNEYSDGVVDQFTSETTIQLFKEKRAQYELFLERLKDYEEYLSMKTEIREKRNETQILLQPDKGKDEKFKSS